MAPVQGQGQGAAQGCQQGGCIEAGGGVNPHHAQLEIGPLLPAAAAAPSCWMPLFLGQGSGLASARLQRPACRTLKQRAVNSGVPSPSRMSGQIGADRNARGGSTTTSPLHRRGGEGGGRGKCRACREPSLSRQQRPGAKSQRRRPEWPRSEPGIPLGSGTMDGQRRAKQSGKRRRWRSG